MDLSKLTATAGHLRGQRREADPERIKGQLETEKRRTVIDAL